MPRLDISLNSNTYAVSCEEGQEARLREVAAFVDIKLKSLVQSKAAAQEAQLLVLVSLLMADQIFDLRADLAKNVAPQAVAQSSKTEAQLRKEIRAEIEAKYVSQIEALTKRVEAVASSLSSV